MSSVEAEAKRVSIVTWLRDLVLRIRWKSIARAFITYALPAALLQVLLLKLGSGALWLPAAWRVVLFAVGMLAGQILFNWARNDPRFELPHPVSPDDSSTARHAEEHSADRSAARKARKHRRDHGLAEFRRQSSAARWVGACALFLLAHIFLRVHCVAHADIPAVVAETFDHRELPDYFDVHQVVAEAGTEVLATESTAEGSATTAAAKSGPYVGTVLIPWRFSDPGNRAKIETRKAEGIDAIQHYLTNSPKDLVDMLAKEPGPIAVTIALFAFVYFGLLATASIAYGRAFTAIEELGAHLGEKLEHFLKSH